MNLSFALSERQYAHAPLFSRNQFPSKAVTHFR